MRRFVIVFSWLALASICVAQTAGTITPGPGNTAGILWASSFGQWSVPQGNTGQFSWSSPSLCTVQANGIPLNPVFAVGTPVFIKDQTAANSEIVTPTAVNVSGAGCSIIVNPAKQHLTYTLGSATCGLQEAINYAHGLPYQVVVTPDWTRLGCGTATITGAHGNSSVSILDERTNPYVAYTWNGSVYVLTPLIGTGCLGGNTIANGCTGATAAAGAWTNIFSGAGISPSCSVLATDGSGALVCSATAYLPLSGGTLTGALNGTTLDFSTLTLTGSGCGSNTYAKADGTGCGTPNGSSPTSICTGSNCNYVAEGDSTSAGAFTMAPSQRWPDQLSQLPIFKSKVVFLNASVSGSTCASMTSRYVGTVQPHKPNGTTILKSFLSVLIGRNDLGNSAATEEACISAYVNQAKTDGFTVMLGTTLPATISPMPPLVPGGIVANITAMNSNAGTNQTIFTAANTFIAGTNVFLSNIGPTPTLGPPTCTATSLSGSAGVLTVSCANTFTSGQWVYFETGGTGAGWTYVNGLWIQILTTGLSGSQFQIPLGVGGTYTVSGTVSSSTGVGANLNNNYCTVEATGLSSTQFACAINGGNWTGSNTGTATPTLAVAWDAITVAQLTELQTVDDWIRRYPVCNLTVTTACVDYMIDLAQLLKDPGNAGIDTYDGTHELPSFAATMAQFAESILDVGSPVLPAQPLNSGVGPQFIQGVDTGQLVVHPQFWTYGASLQTDTIYQPYVNEFWDSSQDGVGGYLEKYNQASDYYFLCNGLTTCEHLTATTVNFPQIAPVVGPGCLQISSTGSVTSSGCITTTASPPLNSATCIKSLTASSVVLGYCSTVVSSSGTCTCN